MHTPTPSTRPEAAASAAVVDGASPGTSTPLPATASRSRAAFVGLLLLLVTSGLSACVGAFPSPEADAGVRAATTAQTQVGVRYVYGASSPGSGFDCSGLTSWAWREAGYSIPRTSASQYNFTERISRDELRPGDLVFYGYSGVSHVVMYIGDGNIVHAPGSGRYVRVESLGSYWTNALIGYGRVPASARIA